MILGSQLKERPDGFRIDRAHPLSQGLVFAGLGRAPGSLQYRDSSPHGNHGTLTNMEPSSDWVWVPKLGRWGLDFDGSDDRVILSRGLFSVSGDFTLASWLYLRWSDTSFFALFGGGGETSCICYRSGAPYLRFSDYTLLPMGPSVPANVLTHYAFTRTGTDYNAAINGQFVGMQSPGKTFDSASLTKIGVIVSATWLLNGVVSDPFAWNRALSPSEIQQLADPSNAMLSGLILPPRRRIFPTAGSAATTIQWPWQQRRHRRMAGAR